MSSGDAASHGILFDSSNPTSYIFDTNGFWDNAINTASSVFAHIAMGSVDLEWLNQDFNKAWSKSRSLTCLSPLLNILLAIVAVIWKAS